MVDAPGLWYIRLCTIGVQRDDFRGVIMEQTFGWKNAVVGVAMTIVVVGSALAFAFS